MSSTPSPFPLRQGRSYRGAMGLQPPYWRSAHGSPLNTPPFFDMNRGGEEETREQERRKEKIERRRRKERKNEVSLLRSVVQARSTPSSLCAWGAPAVYADQKLRRHWLAFFIPIFPLRECFFSFFSVIKLICCLLLARKERMLSSDLVSAGVHAAGCSTRRCIVVGSYPRWTSF
ncbi:unnamed protein product [Urochloa humidicola]